MAKNAKTVAIPKRKLSSKDILGVDGKTYWRNKFKADTNLINLPVYDIAGIAVRAVPGDGDKGEYVKFIGDFIAVNKETGEVFRSNRCFLPKICEEMLAAQMGSVDSGVKFAFAISMVADDDSATGYVYSFESLIEATESDQMAEIAGTIGVALKTKALPASV